MRDYIDTGCCDSVRDARFVPDWLAAKYDEWDAHERRQEALREVYTRLYIERTGIDPFQNPEAYDQAIFNQIVRENPNPLS